MEVALAGVLFLATHFGLSSPAVRAMLVNRLGEQGFLGIYSLIALVTFGYLLWVYSQVEDLRYVWLPNSELYLVPKIAMTLACVLAVGAFAVPNPTSVGQDKHLANDARAAARGVLRITRHPFQWGVVLWAASHMAANGDIHSLVFFAVFLLLSGVGTVLMDHKKAAKLGESWQQYAEVTSNLPFAAIVSGRNQFRFKELLPAIVGGAVLYVAVFWGHEWIAGVPLM